MPPIGSTARLSPELGAAFRGERVVVGIHFREPALLNTVIETGIEVLRPVLPALLPLQPEFLDAETVAAALVLDDMPQVTEPDRPGPSGS